MIPGTHNGLDAFECLSGLQKSIRRGLEREAMEFACEIGHTSKPFFTMLTNRLEIIMHEDIGLPGMDAVVYAATCIEHARRHYDADKPGKWRMMVGNAIRALARSAKSREGDHFQAVVGVPNLELKVAPVVPDWVHDKHTKIGRKLGRGLDHFRSDSAQLDKPTGVDPYEDEAYQVWSAKAERLKSPDAGCELFD
jgi:replication-associated recombination protein RarA